MHIRSSTTTPRLKRTLLVVLSAFAGVILFAGTGASGGQPRSTAVSAQDDNGPKPTIVLIHGAFADASGWSGVITRLQDRGYTVLAPANPVGHSYGGEVITNAATGNPNVKALVYIAAFAPDAGETSGGLVAKFPGSMLTPQNLVFRPFPGGLDGYINPIVFRDVFAADLPAKTTAVMAASQRPGALSTLSDLSGVPAWKTIPSWYMVANQDHAIPPALERFMAARMHAKTVQIDSSHVAMMSHPGDVTDLILSAAGAD